MAAAIAELEVGESSNGGRARRRSRWEDLNRDLLVTIFSKVGVADLIAGVPFVCSTWRDAAKDPACWRALDFRDWDAIAPRIGSRRDPPDDFYDLLAFCITRGHELLESVLFPRFADETDFLYVAESCPELLYFSLENPEIPEELFCEAVNKFKYLKGMAVDESLICHKVLQYVAQCCIYFTKLRVFADMVHEDLVSAICDSLPNLRKLETMGCWMFRKEVLMILDRLKELEYLDISGHQTPGITSDVYEKASRLKVFKWDSQFDPMECGYCSSCEEEYFYQKPCSCEMDQQIAVWMATHPELL